MKSVFFAALAALLSVSASAADTAVVPSAEISAVKDAAGNVIIAWTEPLKVVKVERYVGHGQKWGNVQAINVGDKKSVVLGDIAKYGGRFNLVAIDGRFLHLECGGNPNRSSPHLKGLSVDCSYADPATGELVGALVVN